MGVLCEAKPLFCARPGVAWLGDIALHWTLKEPAGSRGGVPPWGTLLQKAGVGGGLAVWGFRCEAEPLSCAAPGVAWLNGVALR